MAFIAHATHPLREITGLLLLQIFPVEFAQKYRGNRRRLVQNVVAHTMAFARIFSYMGPKNAVNHLAVGFTANVVRAAAENQQVHCTQLKDQLVYLRR